MKNHDKIIRLRYALDIKDTDLVEMFKLGGMEKTREEVATILTKPQIDEEVEEDNVPERCNDKAFEAFLNGFITFKRGPQKSASGETIVVAPTGSEHPNNMLLKKVKIALALTTEDIIEIFKAAGLNVSKGEIGALLRKKGHKNYKVCLDNFARNFLRGLTYIHRGE